ncbi:MAG: hypothetical protein M4D85_05130 [Actinomycetota bacterium]|nr:hypothetical protein [Actinomycetota bacterium]
MRKKIVAVTLVGILGLTGAALLGPGMASAQSEQAGTAAAGGRLQALKDALQGLVNDGTINQSQADKVASTLAAELPRRGHGGPGHGGPGSRGAHLAPAEIAAALEMSEQELRAERRAGKTLTQIAEAKGLSRDTLVDRLVAAGEARLAEKVAAGRLTQAEAEKRKAGLKERVEGIVDRPAPERGPRRPAS